MSDLQSAPSAFEHSQIRAPHLARRRHRERLDEFYLTRVLVGRKARAHPGLEVTRQLGRPAAPGVQLDECLDHLTPDWIWRADRRRQRDRRVALQAILDLARADAIAAARDDVVLAPDEPEVAVRVLPGEITGERPVADELLPRGLLVVPVAQEHHGVGTADR